MLTEAGALMINPNAELRIERDRTSITGITVFAPVKGLPLSVTLVKRMSEPALFAALLIQSSTGAMSPDQFNDAERSRLTDIGLLVPGDRVSTPVRFACDLTNPPDDLIPLRARRPMAAADGDLVTNPTLRHLGRDGPTPDMRGRLTLPNRFRSDRSWLAVDDAGVRAPGFYSFSEESQPGLSALAGGQPPPDSLTPDIRQQLVAAGILQLPVGAEHRRAEQEAAVTAAAARLAHDRYVVLRSVIAPLQLAALRRYYRGLADQGFLVFGDKDWPNRYFTGRDPICHFFHQQLTDLVSRVAGERVKPSFNFFASYHPGSVLPRHRDREQCEYSMSILVDHAPEPDDVSPWPLYLQPPGVQAAVPISLGIGDAALYKGREVLHYRDTLVDAEHYSSWFFFYVPEGFDGPLD